MKSTWLIRRTRPVGLTFGRAITTFINNFYFHLTTVDAYADGAVDAWGFLDLDLFRKKVATGWIATKPPVGARISVFNLGSASTAETRWLLDPQDIVDRVEEVMHELNPQRIGLLDMQGTDVEARGQVSYSKLGRSDKKPCIRTEPLLVGGEVPIFRRNGTQFDLERWFVFADGTSCIGPNEPRRDVTSVMARARAGELCTQVPDGAWINVGALGSFRASGGSWYVDIEERLRELLDVLHQAQGHDSAIEQCRTAYEAFEKEPTSTRRELLRSAYEAVPKHLRHYCGDMDTKDSGIRAAISAKRGKN
jgi:hypothetical protein